MATPQITLQLMTNDVLPSSLHTHRILSTEANTTQIYKGSDAQVQCRFEDYNNRRDPDIIARFHTSKFSCVLEPYDDDVTIEPFPLRDGSDAPSLTPVILPRSENAIKRYIYLRSGDNVHFPHRDLKISVTISAEPSLPVMSSVATPTNENVADNHDAAASVVQVRSSNMDAEPAEDQNSDITADSDEQDNVLDPDISARFVQTSLPDHTTPAAARVTDLTIMETPTHVVASNALTDDDEPYSTAQDQNMELTLGKSEEKDLLNGAAASPSLRALDIKARQATSQGEAGERAVMNGVASDTVDEDKILTVRSVNVTYGNQRSGRKKSKQPQHDDEDETHVDNERPAEPMSDALTLRDVSIEAARRTTRGKRKLEDEADNDENDGARTDITQELGPTDTKEESLQSVEIKDEDEESLQAVPEASLSTRKLKKPTRSTQESGDEIVVASRRTSPQVQIKRQRLSETPTSPTGSPTLAGKVPKILLSIDSTARNNTTLKKWLSQSGASIIDNVPSKRTNFLCVVPKEHRLKSAKVLHSLAMGKLVVTDNWLTTSKKTGQLLDPYDFIHEALEDSVTHDRSRLFAGKRLLFTRSAVENYKNGWKDIRDVAKEAGAAEVDQVAFNKPGLLKDRDEVVLFGSDNADHEVSRLTNEYGLTVYSKELFTKSVISGELMLDKEYELHAITPLKKSR